MRTNKSLKKKVLSLGLATVIVAGGAMPALASSYNDVQPVSEIKTVEDLNRVIAIEKEISTRATVPVVATPVNFTGVTEAEQTIVNKFFKTNGTTDSDAESMANGGVLSVSVRKSGTDYIFRVYTKTLEHLSMQADIIGMSMTDQATGTVYTGTPSAELRPGAKDKKQNILMVPVYIDIQVPGTLVGRGPISSFQNRVFTKSTTNLEQTSILGYLIPDAMKNPKANLAMNLQ